MIVSMQNLAGLLIFDEDFKVNIGCGKIAFVFDVIVCIKMHGVVVDDCVIHGRVVDEDIGFFGLREAACREE